ncbi:MAG TPA: MOSC domain-containing protein [Arachnia sp.]|nr:MOSC domain-containing protein [Arachnia sp.]
MHVSRIGFTALKGARHVGRPFVDLTLDGPVGDRMFCLVDPARGRVVRTVENPTLMQTTAMWSDGVLTFTLPGAVVDGVPTFRGETRTLDYWGRRVELEMVEGPWADAFSAFLGYEVVLARAGGGEVVYGASVSLITTGSLDELSRRVRTRVLDSQLRATFTVHTDAPHIEDAWIGRRIVLGEAEVEVRSAIARCPVIDLDPDTGIRRSEALRALADYRRQGGELIFGVDAVVTRAGRVRVGDGVWVHGSGRFGGHRDGL